jgi:hypothetical protein
LAFVIAFRSNVWLSILVLYIFLLGIVCPDG